MRRHLLTLALVGMLSAFVAADAQACHKRRCPCPAPTPCVVVQPCPPPCPPPVCCEPAPKKCGLFSHMGGCGHKKIKIGGFCHKPVCAPAPVVCETYAPVVYASAPVYAAPQSYGSPQVQASGQ